MAQPFFVKDCALAVVSIGEAAASINELKDKLHHIPTSSLYYHFWGRHFRSSFIQPEFHNDFARWAYFYLHDHVLSERLGIIDPTDYRDLEELRGAIIEIVEQRLDETEATFWVRGENKFHFLRSIIIVFDTSISIEHPSALKHILPTLTPTSIFYHFIDARRRTPTGLDDFSYWLIEQSPAYDELLPQIKSIDPFFLPLTEQRQKLTEILSTHFP